MDPLLFEQLGQALRNDDAETRYKAIHELASTNDTGAVRMAICHARIEGKVAILQIIGQMAQQTEGDWNSLIQSQLDISDNDEKCRILYIMSFIDNPTIHMMAADLFGHEDISVKKAALKVLGKLDKNGKLRLFKKLASHKEVPTRLRAVKSVVAFKHRDIISILKTGLRDSEYDIRIAAYKGFIALQQAGIPEAAEFLEITPQPEAPSIVDSPEPEVIEAPEETSEEVDRGDGGSARLNAVDRLTAEGKLCKNCISSQTTRTDKQKMAPMRLWCTNLKKEVLPKNTCIRGKWN